MAEEVTAELEAWLATLPVPAEDSRWDAIFLMPIDRRDWAINLAWFYQTFIHPQGELRAEFLAGVQCPR